jgi:hypothetical protein
VNIGFHASSSLFDFHWTRGLPAKRACILPKSIALAIAAFA